MIPIFEPFLSGNEQKYVDRCLETNWISSQGDYILQFEKQFASYHQMKHAIVTSNCTTALHIALKAFGIGEGDEVICPDLTFIAPANMIALSGAQPVLVDINPETLALDPHLIEERITERTKAMIVVHQFGHAAPMDQIMALAKRHNLRVIEDNAESLGGKYKDQLLGTIGDISCYSFFANKIITTGEGGAILTNNDEIAEKCFMLRDHGMSRQKKYHHVEMGYNYRMTNLQAAIGLAQLEKLEELLVLRKRQLEDYYTLLKGIPGIKLRQFQEWCEPVHWLMTLSLDKKYDRDNFIGYMKNQGIDCRQMVNPVHQAEHFIPFYNDADYPNAIKVSQQSVHLPSSTNLNEEQIHLIVDKVKMFLVSMVSRKTTQN